MTKAMALSKGYEMDMLLHKAKDDVMRVLFSGGVIRGKKLKRGSVYSLSEIDMSSDIAMPNQDIITCLYENIQLLQRICPIESLLKKI